MEKARHWKRIPAVVGATCIIAAGGLPALAATEYTEIPQSEMTAVATDSVEPTGEGTNGPLNLILDGNNQTYWHTLWSAGVDPLPHWFVVKLADTAVNLGRIDLVPRQSSNGSGRVAEYDIFATNTQQCTVDAFGADLTPVATGSYTNDDSSSTRTITFSPVAANCIKVVYKRSWGGDGTAERVATLAEFKAYTAAETAPENPENPTPPDTDPSTPETPLEIPEVAGAHSITDGTLTVRTHPAFPQVIDYRIGDKQLAGKYGDPLTDIKVDGQTQRVQVGAATVSADGSTVTYPVTFPNVEGTPTLDIDISVRDSVLTYKLTRIQDPQKHLNRIEIPGLDLVSVTAQDAGAQIFAARMSVNRNASGDTLLTMSNVAEQQGTAWMAVAAGSTLAAGFETNAIGDNTVTGGGNGAARFAYAVKTVNNVKVAALSPAQWTYRSGAVNTYDTGNGIGVDDDPFISVKITADANNDQRIDWQDGAIATRDILTPLIGQEDVNNWVITRIPFNIVSQATHPFLRTLDDTKRIALATDGLGQQVLLKGYQAEGHDSAQGDYAGHYNEKAGGLKDLRTLVEEGKNWNATFGIHVNATETYSEAHVFSEELLRMPPQKAWGWMNQSYYMNDTKDLATGNLLRRLQELRADFPADSNLNWLYWDVYYPRGWQGDRFGAEIAKQGWRQGSEWADAIPRVSTWSHWATDEGYGGATNKGINSQLVRFVENSYRDTFNPDPRLGNSNVVEFEGWTGHNNYNAFITNVWERNLPTKFLQRSDIMSWTDAAITFKNGTVVTSPLTTISGREIPTNREITYDGATVYTQGSYLLPWSDTGNDRLYYWNPAGTASTWELTDAWKTQSSLSLFKLTDTGREQVADIPVTDGSVNLPAVEPNTAYVLYPTSQVPPAQAPAWGQGSSINDPGFFSGTLDAYQTSGTASIVKNERGNLQAQLGAGRSSIAQSITVPAGTYSAWAWVQIQPGLTRDVTVSAQGSGITPVANQKGSAGVAATTVHASSAVNATASDEKLGYYFQRVPVRFTTDGSAFTFTVEAGDGEATVDIDDLRIVQQTPPTDPQRTAETIVFDDFENVDDGYGPFVTGSANRGGDARTQMAERHAPYSQSGWFGVVNNTVVEGQKYLDNVLDGQWSLMAHEENGGLILRTTNATVPLERGHKYRVSFDYQTAFNDDYTLVLGNDWAGENRWAESTYAAWPLAAARGTGWRDAEGNAGSGTQRFSAEFSVSTDTPTFLGIVKSGGQNQGDLVIDNFRIEDLGVRPIVTMSAEPQLSADPAMRELLVTTSVETVEGTLTDVAHVVNIPNGWTLTPVTNGATTVNAQTPSVATWKLTFPKTAEAADITFAPTWRQGAEAGEDTQTLRVDPAAFPLLNPIGGADLRLVGVSSEETTGESAPNGFAAAAIDGNPGTFWHTAWQNSSPNFPHWIAMQVKKAHDVPQATCTITGFEYTARADAQNGRARGYEIYVSQDGENWGTAVATGEFTGSTNRQVVEFEPVVGSYVKLVETSSIRGNKFGGAAELRVGGTCTSPNDPVVPETPETPENPTDPVDPENPVDPVDPTDPVDPENPTDPVDPVHARVSTFGSGTDEASVFVAGSQMRIRVSGVPARASVVFDIASGSVVLPAVDASAEGIAEVTWDIPADFPAGSHDVVARFGQSSARAMVTVLPQGTTPPEPNEPSVPDTPETPGVVVPVQPNDTLKAPAEQGSKVKVRGKKGKSLASTGTQAASVVVLSAMCACVGVGASRMRRRQR